MSKVLIVTDSEWTSGSEFSKKVDVHPGLKPRDSVYLVVNALSSRLRLTDESKATAWKQWPASGKDPISVCVWAWKFHKKEDTR